MTTTHLTIFPLFALLGAACIADIRERRIPNALTLGGAGVALVLHVYSTGATGFGLALAGWIVGLGCFLPLYVVRGMAAGDIKLMAMVGAFLGPMAALPAFVCALLAGSVLGSAFFLLQRFQSCEEPKSDDGIQSGGVATAASLRLAQVPYGVAIAIGAGFVVLAPKLVEQIIPMGIEL